MKNKTTLINPTELIIGKRIKIPIAGWYIGSKKKVEWFKGKIIKVGPIKEDGKIHCVITKLWNKKYRHFERMMSLNEQCNEIYKVL